MTAPAGDRNDLRVRGRTDDNGLAPVLLGLCHDPVNPFHRGAGRINDLQPLAAEALVGFPRDAVRADHDCAAVRDLLRVGNDLYAKIFKVPHQMAVMGNGAERHDRSPRTDGLLHQIDRAVHAVAEAGGFSNTDRHRLSPIL